MAKVMAITIKGLGKDDFGLPQYLWATKEQFNALMDAQYDDEKRNQLFTLGDRTFRLSDILQAKEMDLDYAKGLPAFRGYVLEALKKEEQNKIESGNLKKIHELSEGLFNM